MKYQKIEKKINSIQQKILKIYNSRENVIKVFNDYVKIRSKAMYKTKHGTGLKILTLNKCFKDYQ